MKLVLYLAIFVFGLVTGSFLNCVIYRLKINESFVGGRSFCPACRHRLAWYDLILILSFIFLKGKCRYCGRKISPQYPLVELFTGILFVLILNYVLGIMNYEFLSLEFILNSLFLLLISCLLLIIFVYDLKHYIIPDKIIYPAIIIALIFNFHLNHFFSAAVAAAFFLLIILISKGKGMGLGDVKLVFLMGLILGFPKILIALFLAFLVGAIIGLGLILSSRKTLKSEIPFGPFLITGTFSALFWGSQIINWYSNFLV